MQIERDKEAFEVKSTLLLMKNYHILKDLTSPDGKECTILTAELTLGSALYSAERTELLMHHIDASLQKYDAENTGTAMDYRFHRIIESIFTANEQASINEFADTEWLSLSTVYRNINSIMNQLAVILFASCRPDY